PAGNEIASPAAGTVDVTFTNGTAGDADYDNATQNVTIGQVFQVDATDDLISDDEETYTVNLGANSTIAGAITTAYEAVTNSTDDVETTIHDETSPGTPPGPGPHPTPTPNPGPEDTVFAVIESDGPATEGENSTFTVSLIDVNGDPVAVTSDMDVNIVFANGTAEDGDYTATPQTVTVLAGDSTVTVTVPTLEDVDFDNETFTATIDGVGTGADQFENVDTTNGADSRTPSAEATINDNDVPPTISIDDVTVNEDAGTMTFTVTLSNTTTADVTFDYASSNDSALAGADYDAVSGNGTITAGQTTTTITVPITDDYLAEGNESFDITLSNLSPNVAATGNKEVGVGTIVDAGSPPGTIPPGVPPEVPGTPDTVTLKVVATDSAGNIIGDGSENDSNEGGAAYYKVIALDPAGVEIVSPAAGTVDVTFGGGTASAADYDNATQNVTIGQVFQVDATDDLISDDEETYNVSLGANSTIAGA
ncbi:MAG: hypothetical protein OIF55_07535, partial [Amphritea sp.]|nr:hypothetical protein [Amphritea sp.]